MVLTTLKTKDSRGNVHTWTLDTADYPLFNVMFRSAFKAIENCDSNAAEHDKVHKAFTAICDTGRVYLIQGRKVGFVDLVYYNSPVLNTEHDVTALSADMPFGEMIISA